MYDRGSTTILVFRRPRPFVCLLELIQVVVLPFPFWPLSLGLCVTGQTSPPRLLVCPYSVGFPTKRLRFKIHLLPPLHRLILLYFLFPKLVACCLLDA